jgi:hypothetical protein
MLLAMAGLSHASLQVMNGTKIENVTGMEKIQ